jgi:hypothetical protein
MSRLLVGIVVMLPSGAVFLESIPTLRYVGIAPIVLGILLSSCLLWPRGKGSKIEGQGRSEA